ncbi:MAG: hypothetical protein K8I60_19780, partial [Anaerolineae bacterium]|nr:hypothetical protein [Anaerolineae bacterium]
GAVALNIWYTQRADYRGMMNCILSNGSVNPPETFTVYGMSTALYPAPTLNRPGLNPANIRFTAADVLAVGDIPTDATAEQAVCLPLEITLTQPIPGDLKAAVIARNSLGWEVARADAVFATANQRTAASVTPGERLAAYPLLRLPVGAPPGDYDLVLRIYDETAVPSGYDVLSASGTPAGKDAPLGTWTVLPGAVWEQTDGAALLPVPVDIPVGNSLRLIGMTHDTHDSQPVHNGETARLELFWIGEGNLPVLTLAGADWQVDIPPTLTGQHDQVVRDWRDVTIPPDASGGTAELRLSDGTVIARYQVEILPAHYTPPAFATPVGVELPGVGQLVGYTLDGDSFDRTQPVPVTLLWQAAQPSPVSYTVFIQLIGADGQVIAQSDAVPAGWGRPTTGWRPGEYIEDAHQLHFNENAAPGSATLIAGMYDPVSGQRVRLADGTDAIVLAQGIVVR